MCNATTSRKREGEGEGEKEEEGQKGEKASTAMAKKKLIEFGTLRNRLLTDPIQSNPI